MLIAVLMMNNCSASAGRARSSRVNDHRWSAARADDGWSGMDDDGRPADDWRPADDYRGRRLVDDLHRWPVHWLWLHIHGLDLWLLHGDGLRHHHWLGLLVVHLSYCAWCGVIVVHICLRCDFFDY